MKRKVKVVGILAGALLALGLAAWAHLELTWRKDYSSFEGPKIRASTDSAVIERGSYLVHQVAHCSACHQPAEGVKARQAGGQNLVGGNEWKAGPFGNFFAANITPDRETGIGGISDAQIARAIRHGIGRHGEPLPFMSIAVGPIPDEDLVAIVSYLRSLPAVRQENPHDAPGLIGKYILKGMGPRKDPPPAWVAPGQVSVERGSYLANGPAACASCHTELDPLSGFTAVKPRFAGSSAPDSDHTDEAYEVVAPNLTPDPDTGHITRWTEDAFVARFRLGTPQFGTKMPWANFSRMTDEDIRSLYRYLRSLAPVKNLVGPTRRPKGWKPT